MVDDNVDMESGVRLLFQQQDGKAQK